MREGKYGDESGKFENFESSRENSKETPGVLVIIKHQTY